MVSVVGLAPTRSALKGRSLELLCIHGRKVSAVTTTAADQPRRICYTGRLNRQDWRSKERGGSLLPRSLRLHDPRTLRRLSGFH